MATERTDRARASDDGDVSRGRRGGGPVRRFMVHADWPAALLLATLAASLLWLTFLPATQRTVHLAKVPSWFALAGFSGPEDNGSFGFRWSEPDALLTLPVPAADRYAITLILQDAPGAATSRPLTVLVDDTPIATLYPDSTLRAYHLIYTRPDNGAARDAPLQVRLQIPPRTVTGDPRELGIVVASVRWEIARPGAAWQAGLVAVQVALLGLAYAALHALRQGHRATPWLAAYAGTATLLWLVTSLHPAMISALAALGLLFAVRRAPTESLRPLGEPSGQRWLFLIAVLGTWASAPLLLDPDNPADWLRGYIALLLAGVVTVLWLHARRPALALAGYALATIFAAAWWYWLVGPCLAALAGLPPYNQEALRLVPWILLLFAAAGCALARVLPPTLGCRFLVGDLLAGLAAVALPAGIWLSGWSDYSALEDLLRTSWPGGILILLIAAKTLVNGAALWRAAPGMATERQVALTVLALFIACYWSLVPWRVAAMGLSGDEPAYLAAALTLARDRDLELTNNGYSPWMLARIHHADDAWVHEYPEIAHDRAAGNNARPPAARHALPVVAGPGLRGEISVTNPSTTATEISLDLGEPGTAAERFSLAPYASRLIDIPAGVAWLDATVEASTPVAVGVRLIATTGAIDAYGVDPPTNQFCLPLPSLPVSSETLLFLHNSNATPSALNITRYNDAGLLVTTETPTIPANATLNLSVPAQAATHTVCVAADQSLTAVALVQAGGSALLALPAPPPSYTPLAIPPALTPPHQVGTVALVAHNPGELPVRVWSAAGTEPTATIPAHGTAQIELAAPAGSEAQPQDTLETDGPLSAYFLLTIDSHRAALSPATAGSPLWFTAIVGESRRFVATSVALQNPTPTPLPIVATLLDDQGQVRDERRLTLCGRCISSVRLDFTDDDGTLSDADGAIVVRADSPLIASATQLTTQTQSFYHAWGLALPLVPGVAIAGVLGALLTIAGCGALLMAQLYGLVRDSGISRQVAIATILALGLASPILTYSLQLYPEIPALLLLITGLRLALGALPLRGWRLIAAAVCTLTIPLLHARLLPLAAVVAVCLGWRLLSLGQRAWRTLLLALLVPLGFLALWWFASPMLPPILALSARLSASTLNRYFEAAVFGHHLAGITLDRATGLLPATPVLLIAPVGLIVLARRAPRYAIWPGLLIGLQFVLVAMRADGWESWGPPGRYLLPIVPLLGLGVAGAWSDWSPRWLRILGAALAVWGWLIALVFAWVPHAGYYDVAARRWWGDLLLRDWGWLNPLRLFPDIKAGWPFEVGQVVPWLILLVVIVGAGVRWRALFSRERDGKEGHGA